jgi:hypothetical protein
MKTFLQLQWEDAEAPPGADDIYKIGRTSKTNPEDRLQKYRSKANYENEVFIILTIILDNARISSL